MFELLLGHLVGDYLLQTSWMAINKSKYNLVGWLAALVHCIIYTLSICVLMNNYDLLWVGAVFLSHFPIDKFSLGEVWMKYIKGYSLKNFLINKSSGRFIPNNSNREEIVQGGFLTFVYILTDNTIHLLLMWGAYQLIY